MNQVRNKNYRKRIQTILKLISEEQSDCHQQPNIASGDLGLVQEENSGDSHELLAEKQDVIRALLKGLALVEQMEGSVADFEDVLTFSK